MLQVISLRWKRHKLQEIFPFWKRRQKKQNMTGAGGA